MTTRSLDAWRIRSGTVARLDQLEVTKRKKKKKTKKKEKFEKREKEKKEAFVCPTIFLLNCFSRSSNFFP